jgi:hypothetical protein
MEYSQSNIHFDETNGKRSCTCHPPPDPLSASKVNSSTDRKLASIEGAGSKAGANITKNGKNATINATIAIKHN